MMAIPAIPFPADSWSVRVTDEVSTDCTVRKNVSLPPAGVSRDAAPFPDATRCNQLP